MSTVIENSFFDHFRSISVENPKVILNTTLAKNIIKESKSSDGNYICKIDAEQKKQLKFLLKASKEEYGYKNEFKYGRVYHNSIIQFVPKIIRNTLLFSNFYDVDIKNCHPVLLYNLCIFHKIKCEALEDFVTNRDIIFEAESRNYSREKLKTQISTILYGGICELLIFKSLEKEVQSIIPKLIALYPDVYNFAEAKCKLRKSTKKYQDNFTPSFLSYLLTTIENRIITIAYDFFKKNKINTGLILHDGIFVSNQTSFDNYKEEIIPKLNNYIKENYYNFEINFIIKDFSTEILDGACELVETTVLNDKDLVNYFYEFYKDTKLIFFKKTEFYICNSFNIWEKKDNEGYIKNLFELPEFNNYLLSEHDATNSFTTEKQFNNIFRLLKLDTRFYKDLGSFEFDKNPTLFSFSNGKCLILNKCNKDEPYKVRNIEGKDFISMTCGYDLPDDYNFETNCLKYKDLITNMFQDLEVAENYLDLIGTSLYGELLVKGLVMSIGSGNNGGSFIASVYKNVFGDYYGTFNSSYFVDNGNNDGIRDPEAIGNAKKRMICVQEPNLQNGVQKLFLNVSKIKLYTGNDEFPVRLLNSNTIVLIRNRALIVIRSNGAIKVLKMDSALYGRLIMIPQNTEFVRNLENVLYDYQRVMLKDTAFVETDEFRLSILSLLLQHWIKFVNNDCDIKLCKTVQDFTDENNSDFISDFMKMNFPKTTDLDKFVKFDDIYEAYCDNTPDDKRMSFKSFKQDLERKRYVITKIDKVIKKVRHNYLAVLYVDNGV